MEHSDDIKQWDIRLVERSLRRGNLTLKDQEKHLKGLQDVAEKGIVTPADGEAQDA